MKVFALITISVLSVLILIFNKFFINKIIRNKKFWKGFLKYAPSVLITLIIGVPVLYVTFWVMESELLTIIAFIFILFLPFK